MDNDNWRPSIPKGEPAMDTGDWRSQLPPDSRQKIINKIMETLMRHLPHSGPEGINELSRIAARFEEKTFSSAVNQSDYLRKISMKMMTMETKSQNAAGASSSIPAANNATSMDSIPNNQGQLLQGTLPNNQSQAPPPLMAQTMQSNTASGMTGSTGLPSSMPPVSPIANNNVSSVVNQNSNMQNVAGMLQDSSVQHGLSSNMISGSQRQMLARPHTMSSQQQQQSQSAQYLYQQQQLLRQNFQSGNVTNPNSHLASQIQQQQQNVLHPNQMQSSQQPGSTTSAMQPSAVSSAPLQGPQTNQQLSPQLSAQQQTTSQSILRQHQTSLLRQNPQAQQTSGIHQLQTSLPQQSISPQQQAQMMRQQAASSSGIQQKQMMGPHVVGDMQQQQHQQRLLNQQNNIMNMQQQQKQHPPAQQQLMSQQNSFQATPQGTQSNVAGLQRPQQQLLSSQTNQQSVHMLSQPTVGLQQTHQSGHGLYPSQGQQSQNQPSQQQMMPLQSHHQQLQQPNLLQQDVQQRLQSSGQVPGSLLPPQNVVDQQRQLYQSQRTLPEMPSSSLDSTAQTESGNAVDWQEEVFQKIKTMKDAYFPDLTEIYQRVTAKLQHDPLLPQQRPEQFEKLKQFKTMLERMMQFLSVSKSSIMPPLKNKVAIYEKQIIDFVTMHRPRKQVQQGQLPQSQMQPMQQQSSQNGNQSHDSQANPQMQSMRMPRAQQSSLENMQNNVLSSRPGASAPQQNIPSSSVPALSLESGQGNALNNGQQVAMRSMQQNTYQQVNNSSASAQSGLSTLQSNVNQTELSPSLLQQQHFKQQKNQQMTSQQLRQQCQQRQIQQQQQLIQQQQQQLQARQQVAQNDMNVSRGMFQQHSLQDQRATYSLQQLKPGSQLPVSSPQLLPGSSPQMTQQHFSPQVDQKNVISSLNKTGTPGQPANSPFVIPSPSTPLAPSPMQVDSDKPSGASSLSMGNIARQQATGVQGLVQSFAFGTPGISASPLLQEFISPDGNNLNPMTSTSGKSSATELPIERLIRAVKSISPQSLSSAVSDIGSVVSMVDRMGGNGSRASVGEDLVAMTKCRLQARSFMAQEGMMPTKKMKRHTTAMPLSVYSLEGSVGDNCKQFACSETSDLESTATSIGKKARTETEHALLEEIKEINQRLIDTVVEISDDEDAADGATSSKGCEGTTVRFSFIAVSLSPALKAHLKSTQMSPIQPLRLLVPCSYPNGSPSLMDKLPVETSKENEDLTFKAMTRFNILLRSLSQPMSLKDIAKTWDACARTVICEYAQQFGGGTFSSKYGTWEKFVAAF
ncbi:unnamed protein product [Eruca vesicaria subsp. sativa]|uniref:Mediator complex subunit 15 KIX domain-containing protein n=1 Tax=Eruca vesicaria subsp. sativa TaxID=29727 RepID=A0ABC8KAJ3_ERUVS|nr:unnamed protein product [Eruca vesicaria subsp. sativa]